jgi:energy-coupling factor transport system permease protein
LVEVIHPAVRICILLIGATAISLGNNLVLATTFLVVAFCYWYCPESGFQHGLLLLKRMRWFFLSIVIVYFWFTPGQAIFFLDGLSHLIPTVEGLLLGLHRIAILALIVLMVNLLLQTTISSRLLAAIYWWVRPLKYVGVKPHQIALRVSLVLGFVQHAHQLIDEVKQSVLAKNPQGVNKAGLLGEAVGEVIYQVELRAGQENLEPVKIPEADNPSRVQWLIPLGIFITILGLQISWY